MNIYLRIVFACSLLASSMKRIRTTKITAFAPSCPFPIPGHAPRIYSQSAKIAILIGRPTQSHLPNTGCSTCTVGPTPIYDRVHHRPSELRVSLVRHVESIFILPCGLLSSPLHCPLYRHGRGLPFLYSTRSYRTRRQYQRSPLSTLSTGPKSRNSSSTGTI